MIDKLKALKEKSHMTNQQIAEKSGVPESTIARIFSGKTPNPTVVTIIPIIRAMGGSPSDFFDDISHIDLTSDTADAEKEPIKSSGVTDDSIPKDFFERYHAEVIAMYQSALKKKDAWIKKLFWCLVAIVGILLLILLFDILNGNVGYVRY